VAKSASREVGVSQNMTFQPLVKRRPLPSQRIIGDKSLSNPATEVSVKVSSLVETQTELSFPNNVSTPVPITLTSEHSQVFMDEPPRLESVADNNSVDVAGPVINDQYLQLNEILLETGRVHLQSSPLQIVKAFKEKVYCVEFLPDSRRLLVASGKDLYCFDELNQPVETKRLDSSHSITCLAISPDSCYAALATDHGELQVADLRTGLVFRTISTLQSGPRYVAFSHDTQLISCALNDKSLILVKLSTGKVVKKLKSFMLGHKGPVTWSSFTSEGRIFSLCSGGYLCVWDNKEHYKLSQRVSVGNTLVLASAKFSDIIALAAGENVHIWHTEPQLTNTFHHDIRYRNGVVKSLDFLPCGTRLLLSREHGAFELWRLTEHPRLIVTLSGRGWAPTWTLFTTSLAPNRSQLSMTNLDGTVRTLDLQSAIRVDTIRMHASLAVFTSISGDGTKVASICPNPPYQKPAAYHRTVIIWDLQTESAMHFLQIKTNSIHDAIFSPDSQKLAVISTNGSATIWAVGTGKLTNVVGRPFHSDYTLACATISSDFGLLATVEYNKIHWGIRVWNVENGTTRCFLGWYEITKQSYLESKAALREAPEALRFLNDSSRLVGGNWHGIYVCDIGQGSMQYYSSETSKQAHRDPMGKLIRQNTRELLKECFDDSLQEKKIAQEPYHWNHDLAVSSDSETAAFLSADGTAYLYDLKTQQEPTVFRGWYGSGKVAISPNWQFLVTTSHENKVLIWDISSGDIIEILHTAESPARAVMFSSDSRLIFILSEGGLLMYDTGSPQPPSIIPGFPSYVRSLSFSPNLGRVIVASASDGVQIWDYSKGLIIQTFNGYKSRLKTSEILFSGRTF
jgi:WD40 repeat protein